MHPCFTPIPISKGAVNSSLLYTEPNILVRRPLRDCVIFVDIPKVFVKLKSDTVDPRPSVARPLEGRPGNPEVEM